MRSTLHPTLDIAIYKITGSNEFGEPIVAAEIAERVAPVRLIFSVENTTVRTDSAATKAQARESIADVVILVMPDSQVAKDDRLEILGHSLRVTAIHPRYTVAGRLDHFQVDCKGWS